MKEIKPFNEISITNLIYYVNKIKTLRHTFASHLAINGTPIFNIQKLMNHKDITMTMRYVKLAPDSGREAIENLFF
ncbi:tyrosine-type recombinase/integrase [Arcobacter cloacae]|uniref:tyrosine-type recombinase/integrase n=1 Tax=Arcobacter cloacae TaxID=1054034 RepID=UPI0019D6FD7A|nr:tyrosine-type recombinase/integrase [Arcobacter cloacae]